LEGDYLLEEKLIKEREERKRENQSSFGERDEKYIHQDKTKKQVLIPRAREFNKTKQQKDLYLSIFNWARKRGERGPDRNHTCTHSQVQKKTLALHEEQ
jgi:hypothetical protein